MGYLGGVGTGDGSWCEWGVLGSSDHQQKLGGLQMSLQLPRDGARCACCDAASGHGQPGKIHVDPVHSMFHSETCMLKVQINSAKSYGLNSFGSPITRTQQSTSASKSVLKANKNHSFVHWRSGPQTIITALNWTHFILKKPGITRMIYEVRQVTEKKRKIFFSNPTWQQKRQKASLCKGRLRALGGLDSFWSWSWVSITCRRCLCWATSDSGAQGKSRLIRSTEEKSIAFLLWRET